MPTRLLICALLALVPVLAGCGATESAAPRVEVKAAQQGRAAAAAQAAAEALRARRRAGRERRGRDPRRPAPPRRRTAPKPTGPASGTLERHDAPSAINGGTKNATALDNGVALPPLEAPTEVLKIIEAGNAIARTPYKWGGGHGALPRHRLRLLRLGLLRALRRRA